MIKPPAPMKPAPRAVGKRPDSRPILDAGSPRDRLSPTSPKNTISKEQLVAALAKRVMGWGVGPDRFLMGNRGWMPRWRFQPVEKLEDAFRLLEEAAPQEYSICGDDKGSIHVRVRIAGSTGEASGTSKPLAIAHAVARAVGIEIES